MTLQGVRRFRIEASAIRETEEANSRGGRGWLRVVRIVVRYA